jgi:hypothetical protein
LLISLPNNLEWRVKGNDEAVQLAMAILRFRKYRALVLSRDIFGEPAWEVLLELFVADANSVRITGRIIAEKHDISTAVIGRWLKHLTAEGLLIGDGTGNVDDELTLSGVGMDKMETALLEARFLKDQFGPQPSIAN